MTLAEASEPPSSCPMHMKGSNANGLTNEQSKESTIPADSVNFIPTLSNVPAPGQADVLQVDRQISSIPKKRVDGSDGAQSQCPVSHDKPTSGSSCPRSDTHDEQSDKWVYPSEQQFYNALKRKGYETDEKEIPMVVSIHNDMNERCWQEIVRWEALQNRQVAI
jgi:cytochrome c heme-lyase